MGDSEKTCVDMIHRHQSPFQTSPPSLEKAPVNPKIDTLISNPMQNRPFVRSQTLIPDNLKRLGMPPSHPQSHIPPISPFSHLNRHTNPQSSSHSRSLSQSSFFSLDSLPPLSPVYPHTTPISEKLPSDLSIEDRAAGQIPFFLSPTSRRSHKRSNSDIPFGFSSLGSGEMDRSVKRESSWDRIDDCISDEICLGKSEGEVVDDLFSAYMNLDSIEGINSSGTDEKRGNENRESFDSRTSGNKTNGGDSSDNEAESSMNECGSYGEKREGIKRRATGDGVPTSRHFRSVSMDSFIGNMQFGDESPKLSASRSGEPSLVNALDRNFPTFSMEFGNGEFSGAEMKKIMANEKLAEIALTDPKRAKRILANRQSAARSKERKMLYISELEHKVQTLQIEATTLSAQLTLLQRDSLGLTSQNNELKFRVQSMEQQAQLRDALNEALTSEVQRLKLATTEISLHQLRLQQNNNTMTKHDQSQ